MKTIQELTTQIEELEKRIRTISTAQTTISQLSAIKDYISNVQYYLQELNASFDDHVNNCTDYSTAIETINSQIATINNQLANTSNVTEEQITQITTTLSSVSTNLNNFLGTGTATLNGIENDISAIQTDLATCQEDIEDLGSEMNAINLSIGEQNTTISNLQTTQTNLSTTQTNQACTISANTINISTNTNKIAENSGQITLLNERVDTCETNMSLLSGGVDLSSFENRLSVAEETAGKVVVFQKVDCNITPSDNVFCTRMLYFTTLANSATNRSFTLKYNCSSATGTMTIKLYSDPQTLELTEKVDLSKYPKGYRFEAPFITTYRYNQIQLRITTTSSVEFNSLQTVVTGNNLNLVEYDNEISAITFNGYIYITRHYPTKITYGKFSTTDTIDLDNLPNELLNYDDNRSYSYMCFTPYPTLAKMGEEYFSNLCDAILKDSYNGKKYFFDLSDNSEISSNSTVNYRTSNDPIVGSYAYIMAPAIVQDMPSNDLYNFGCTITPYSNIIKKKTGPFLFNCIAQRNYKTMSDLANSDKTFVFLHENGSFYLMPHYKYGLISFQVLEVGKGTYATAYVQPDEKINVYLTNGNNVDKYSFIKDASTEKYSGSFIQTISNCDRVFETLNDKIIKHSSSGWTIAELEY